MFRAFRGTYLLAGGIPSEKGRRLFGGRGRCRLSQQPQPTFRSSPRKIPEAASPYKSPGSTDPGAAGNAPSWFPEASLPTFGCSRPQFFSKSVDSLKTSLNKATDTVSNTLLCLQRNGRVRLLRRSVRLPTARQPGCLCVTELLTPAAVTLHSSHVGGSRPEGSAGRQSIWLGILSTVFILRRISFMFAS